MCVVCIALDSLLVLFYTFGSKKPVVTKSTQAISGPPVEGRVERGKQKAKQEIASTLPEHKTSNHIATSSLHIPSIKSTLRARCGGGGGGRRSDSDYEEKRRAHRGTAAKPAAVVDQEQNSRTPRVLEQEKRTLFKAALGIYNDNKATEKKNTKQRVMAMDVFAWMLLHVLMMLCLNLMASPTMGSESTWRHCCDHPYVPPPPPTVTTPSTPTQTQKAPLPCTTAVAECDKDEECSQVLQIIPQVCGESSAREEKWEYLQRQESEIHRTTFGIGGLSVRICEVILFSYLEMGIPPTTKI
ncbi:unnamed protein product [Cyprideis torosa]|uniref:Uncharacterized protein n=1 Tax=Cyprideis torosa TaxID=163714 RepID=A0A7R8ZQ72_9CRUS|nr:unnamed protein product [Cyprideis torosa]CAG0891437.1 unnamed protein product [Cyprideis torosa]